VFSASLVSALAAGVVGFDPRTVGGLATGLLSLYFSRGRKTDADKHPAIFFV